MKTQEHILIVDDDEEIRNLLQEFLQDNFYQTSVAEDGDAMFACLEKQPDIELIILDVMLPGRDGFALCQEIRKNSCIPIIMLTAVKEDCDQIVGLELGADDYLAKPFNPRQLLARIKAVLRRSQVSSAETSSQNKTKIYKFSGWTLDVSTRQLFSPEEVEIPLTSGVYELLVALVEHPQRVLSRDQLLDFTKNRLSEPFDRSIDILVSRLRQKIEENPRSPKIIKTIRSGGYLFGSPVKIIEK